MHRLGFHILPAHINTICCGGLWTAPAFTFAAIEEKILSPPGRRQCQTSRAEKQKAESGPREKLKF